MGIIKEMYYGKLSPTERGVVRGSHYDNELQSAGRITEELKKLLPDKTDLIEKLESNNLEMLSINEAESYETGFRHGARFMMDILTGSSRNFKNY